MSDTAMKMPDAHPWGDIPITAEGRSALNSALTNSPEWPALRDIYGVSTATILKDQRLWACHHLAIDAPAILAKAQGETTAAAQATAAAAQMAAPVPAPAPAPAFPAMAMDSSNPMALLQAAIAGIAGQAMNPEQIALVVEAKIQDALAKIPSIKIEVKTGDSVQAIEGLHHARFPTLMKAAAARQSDGYHPNIWLAGPTGSGKTHAARAVAKGLGLDFSFHGAMGMAFELVGYKDAGGVYHPTEFRRIFENGGVILLDECDAYDANATLALNAALANGMASFPDGLVKRHPDCVIIAAGNTWGGGGTAEYVGRAKIDAAFLSRFPVNIAWDYDLALEVQLSGNEQWALRVQNARMKAREKGLKVVIDPRITYAGAALIASGFTPNEAAAETYLAKLTTEQRTMIGE